MRLERAQLLPAFYSLGCAFLLLYYVHTYPKVSELRRPIPRTVTIFSPPRTYNISKRINLSAISSPRQAKNLTPTADRRGVVKGTDYNFISRIHLPTMLVCRGCRVSRFVLLLALAQNSVAFVIKQTNFLAQRPPTSPHPLVRRQESTTFPY